MRLILNFINSRTACVVHSHTMDTTRFKKKKEIKIGPFIVILFPNQVSTLNEFDNPALSNINRKHKKK